MPDEEVKYKVSVDSSGLDSDLAQLKNKLDMSFMAQNGFDTTNPMTLAYQQSGGMSGMGSAGGASGFNAPQMPDIGNMTTQYFTNKMSKSNFQQGLQNTREVFARGNLNNISGSFMDLWFTSSSQRSSRFTDIENRAREEMSRGIERLPGRLGMGLLDIVAPLPGMTDAYHAKYALSQSLFDESTNLVTSQNSERASRRGLTYKQTDKIVNNILDGGQRFSLYNTKGWEAALTGSSQGVQYNQQMDTGDITQGLDQLMQTGALTGARNVGEIQKKIKDFLRSKLDTMRTLQMGDDQAYSEFIGQMNSMGATDFSKINTSAQRVDMASRASGVSTQDILNATMSYAGSNRHLGINTTTLMDVYSRDITTAGTLYNMPNSGINQAQLQRMGGITGLSQFYNRAGSNFMDSQYGMLYNQARAGGYKGTDIFKAMDAAGKSFRTPGEFFNMLGKTSDRREDMYNDYSDQLAESGAALSKAKMIIGGPITQENLQGYLQHSIGGGYSPDEAKSLATKYLNMDKAVKGQMEVNIYNEAERLAEKKNQGVFSVGGRESAFKTMHKSTPMAWLSKQGGFGSLLAYKMSAGYSTIGQLWSRTTAKDQMNEVNIGNDYNARDIQKLAALKTLSSDEMNSIGDMSSIRLSTGRMVSGSKSGANMAQTYIDKDSVIANLTGDASDYRMFKVNTSGIEDILEDDMSVSMDTNSSDFKSLMGDLSNASLQELEGMNALDYMGMYDMTAKNLDKSKVQKHAAYSRIIQDNINFAKAGKNVDKFKAQYSGADAKTSALRNVLYTTGETSSFDKRVYSTYSMMSGLAKSGPLHSTFGKFFKEAKLDSGLEDSFTGEWSELQLDLKKLSREGQRYNAAKDNPTVQDSIKATMQGTLSSVYGNYSELYKIAESDPRLMSELKKMADAGGVLGRTAFDAISVNATYSGFENALNKGLTPLVTNMAVREGLQAEETFKASVPLLITTLQEVNKTLQGIKK
jgi:hypothetical protein